jgi:hypothetical protein
MPKQVGRFYIAPTFAFAPGAFDEDGKYEAYDSGEGSLFKLPTEFRLSYTAPLAGLRQRALHSITLQTRFYFR